MVPCTDHKWMGSVPHGDLLLFCTAMSGLTYFYHNQVRQHDRHTHRTLSVSKYMGNDGGGSGDGDDVLAHCSLFLSLPLPQTSVMSPTLLWVFKWLHKSKSD